MKLKALLAALSAASLLAACGGGGSDAGTSPFGSGNGAGNGSGTGTGSGAAAIPTMAVALTDSSGASTAYTVAGQNYTFTVTLKNAAGSAVSGVLVTGQSSDFTFTSPSNAKRATETNGAAVFTVAQASNTVSGAAQICATATVDTETLTQCAVVEMGAATATLGALTVGSSTVSAYQSIQVSVPATAGGKPATGVPVSFEATCGTLSASNVATDSSGVAKVTYTNQLSGGGACSGTVRIDARTTPSSSPSSTTITAEKPVPSNIQFVGASPARIYLQGVPGSSSSVVKFKLLDESAKPIASEPVLLDLVLYPSGTYLSAPGKLSEEKATDSNGEVSVSVISGTAPGPVQVRARLKSDTSIANVSNGLSVASGLPTQNRFSLSVSTFNIEAWEVDGVKTALTIRAADRLGNPVPDGTAINFVVAPVGQVVASCLTTGTAANDIAQCSVQFSSQDTPPVNGRVVVLAWAKGEESFVDLSNPSDNVFNGNDTFVDLGQPFLDANLNGSYDVGEYQADKASGTSACPAGTGSVPDTCNGTWGAASVRRTAVIVLSGSEPDLTRLNAVAARDADNNTCTYSFTLQDARGNPLPAGTKLSVVTANGGIFTVFSGQGETVPNTNDASRTVHVANFSSCSSENGLSATVKVTTPSGIATNVTLP
ncbi:Ig-like domain-containing protein [Aquabacterium sp.]|uniref:Ig-like domain-containing protein n=1 Tax=Aquabacterium sp. TaxID=1872578 RepID=UPI0035B329FA